MKTLRHVLHLSGCHKHIKQQESLIKIYHDMRLAGCATFIFSQDFTFREIWIYLCHVTV